MMGPETLRKELEKQPLYKIINERDRIIKEIYKYEKDKILEKEFLRCPSPDTEYYYNNLYLAELCYLINEKSKNID